MSESVRHGGTQRARRPWKPPMLSELSLVTMPAAGATGAEPPTAPQAASSKPGLSYEFAFPMAVKAGST